MKRSSGASSTGLKSGVGWTRRELLAMVGAVSIAPLVYARPSPRRHYEQTGEAPSIEDLRRYLQMALEVEHATIPTYLAALYSIKPGANIEIATLIRQVVIEEMLHMGLVANLLNAVGGEPRTRYKGFVPDYPAALPHSQASFAVPLERFSYDLTRDVFMEIEQPKAYAQRCAFCHGLTLNATRLKIDPDGTETRFFETNGAPPLLGQPPPAKTVPNYWPYATTLFDYIRRTMPFYEPGHLSNDEVYSLCAFILGEARIIDKDQVINRETLPAVEMPNRNGFIDRSQAQ